MAVAIIIINNCLDMIIIVIVISVQTRTGSLSPVGGSAPAPAASMATG